MSVTSISFPAHAADTEIDLIKPPDGILVHGDASEGCGCLRYALETRYKDGSVRIIAPRNLQTVELQFRAQKVAKTVGTVAAQPPTRTNGTRLSGLLVRKNYTDDTLVKEEDSSKLVGHLIAPLVDLWRRPAPLPRPADLLHRLRHRAGHQVPAGPADHFPSPFFGAPS